MKRRLFTFASAMSLLVWIATAMLMIRSYIQPEVIYFWWDPHRLPPPPSPHGEVWMGVTLHRSFEIESNNGVLTAATSIPDGPIKPGRVTICRKPMFDFPQPGHWPLISFQVSPRHSRWIPDFAIWEFQVSMFVPLVGFAVMPCLWLLAWRRASHRRKRDGFPVIPRVTAAAVVMFFAIASATLLMGCCGSRNSSATPPDSPWPQTRPSSLPADVVTLSRAPTVLYVERPADISDAPYADFVEGIVRQCLGWPAPTQCVVVLWPDGQPGPLRVFEGEGSLPRFQKFGHGLWFRYGHSISEDDFETGLKRCAEMALARHAGLVVFGRELQSDLGRAPLPLLRRLSKTVRISIVSYGVLTFLNEEYRDNISGLYMTLTWGQLDVSPESKPRQMGK